jgi:hypothetical protein
VLLETEDLLDLKATKGKSVLLGNQVLKAIKVPLALRVRMAHKAL